MNNRYRIIYYVPSSKHRSRYAVGVLYENNTGNLDIIQAKKLPCNCCFDFNRNHSAILESLLSQLKHYIPDRIEVDWINFTTRLELGPIARYPSKVKDIYEWMRWQILPR